MKKFFSLLGKGIGWLIRNPETIAIVVDAINSGKKSKESKGES